MAMSVSGPISTKVTGSIIYFQHWKKNAALENPAWGSNVNSELNKSDNYSVCFDLFWLHNNVRIDMLASILL